MDVREAIPILEQAVAKLEAAEPAWKNCRSCPHGGKCCDGAPIDVVFPEEAEAIVTYLVENPEYLAYASKRASTGKLCYFHNPQAKTCLIHSVRPILCRWTPYSILTGDGTPHGMIRDKYCNFSPIRSQDRISMVKPGILEVRPKFGPVKKQKFINLQGITSLHPLLARSAEAVTMASVLMLAVNRAKKGG